MLIGTEQKILGFDFSVVASSTKDEMKIIRSGFVPLEKLIQKITEPVSRKRISELTNWFVAYQDGEFINLTGLTVCQTGSLFTKKVWREISKIKAGKTLSYQELAQRAGNARAYRAAGTACGRNNLPLFVPCHRVVPGSGGIGNYAFGVKIKQTLLMHERDMHHTQKLASLK